MPTVSLTPISPTPGQPVEFGVRSPVWIGSGADSLITISVPGVGARSVMLVEREDGWYASAEQGSTTINGSRFSGSIRLGDGDVIEVTAGYRYRFSSGRAALGQPAAPPRSAPAPARQKPRPSRKRPRPERERVSIAVVAVVTILVLALAGAGVVLWRAMGGGGGGPAELTEQQSATFDSLMVAAEDHVERGSALLEANLRQPALQEFARAVNTIALSPLRDHPRVQPTIAALEASVASIYREKRLVIPPGYAGKTSRLGVDQMRTATLSAAEFALAFGEVETEFTARFGTPLRITGRDHAEHLSLYGPGGAVDLGTKTLSVEQVRFLTAACLSRKIRVKDFSQDSILARQIAAARAAGLFDRAGTGLHLHVDRFGGRRDRWTVTGSAAGPSHATSEGT